LPRVEEEGGVRRTFGKTFKSLVCIYIYIYIYTFILLKVSVLILKFVLKIENWCGSFTATANINELLYAYFTCRGSAATGLVCALCAVQGPKFLGIPSNMYVLGYVASLATKLSDTFASEIGKAYGKTTFLITTLERVLPGTEGAVSLEGTAASIVGGTLMSLYGLSIGLISRPAVPISIFAAFVATNIESVLGATLQGKENLKWITNEVVNFLNTLIGAAIAIFCGMVFL
jgi:uncharacterized protein (TIGR00297 family)